MQLQLCKPLKTPKTGSVNRTLKGFKPSADVYTLETFDVSPTSAHRAFARIFYIRGKSLLFCAFDLSQQAGSQGGSFQVWAVPGQDKSNAVSLGILRSENDTKRRWILRCDDSNKLTQIDAVYVTKEPAGGSAKPSGKEMLYAALGSANGTP